jgi:hypothetical protein
MSKNPRRATERAVPYITLGNLFSFASASFNFELASARCATIGATAGTIAHAIPQCKLFSIFCFPSESIRPKTVD